MIVRDERTSIKTNVPFSKNEITENLKERLNPFARNKLIYVSTFVMISTKRKFNLTKMNCFSEEG